MSRSLKITIWVIVAVVVVGAVWWWLAGVQSSTPPVVSPTSENTQQPSAMSQSVPPSSSVSANGLSEGNSDAALQKDLLSVDSQLGSLASDSSAVNQGLADQPIAQEK